MADQETNLQNLLRQIVKMHPGEARIIEIDPETENRAWRAYKLSVQKIAPQLEQLRQDRIAAYTNAMSVIIG